MKKLVQHIRLLTASDANTMGSSTLAADLIVFIN
jgi:hypothetical protein